MSPAEFTAARKRLGLNQAEVAAKFGVATNTIIAVEKGRSEKFGLYWYALQGLLAEQAAAS